MRILFVQQQPCIRALKYIAGFKQIAPDIVFLFAYIGKTLTEFYGHGDEMVSEWCLLEGDVKANLKTFVANNPVDLIHCHNAPDTLTNICIDLFKGSIPIVHDIHDLMSARHTSYEDGVETNRASSCWREEEKRAIEECDAVITVADEIFSIAKENGIQLPAHALVYPNYLPGTYIPDELPISILMAHPAKIVYEGFVSSDPDSHYYFIDLFKSICDQGYEMHIYPSRENDAYIQLAKDVEGIYCYDRLAPKDLYRELVKYDFGWCGFNDSVNKQHLDTVLPNKFFEYISCGLPVISLPHKTLIKVIEEYQVGIVIPSTNSMHQELERADLDRIKQNVLKARYDFTVEANLPKVLTLYQSLQDQQNLVESGEVNQWL